MAGERRVRPDSAVRWEITAWAGVLAARAIDRKAEADWQDRHDVEEEANASLDGSGDYIGVLAERQAIDASRSTLAAAERAKRGCVQAWTASSRRNLIRTVGQITDTSRWVMVTLTCRADWGYLPDGGYLTPSAFRAQIDATRKRVERACAPWVWSGVWKMEFQRRGAPHVHVALSLPADVEPERFAMTVKRAWHSVHCHGGRMCGDACGDAAHASRGVHVDFAYARRLSAGSKSIGRYFAKHGVWGSKDYQHVRPWDTLRAAAGYVALVTGRKAGDMLDLAALWENAGRWWGVRQCARDALLQGADVDANTVHVMRLLMRKVHRRRSQRLVYLDLPGRYWSAVVTRPLWSLYGDRDRGFWAVSSDGQRLLRWALETAAGLAHLEGRALAGALADVEIPDWEPERYRAARAAANGVGRWTAEGGIGLVSSVISGREMLERGLWAGYVGVAGPTGATEKGVRHASESHSRHIRRFRGHPL